MANYNMWSLCLCLSRTQSSTRRAFPFCSLTNTFRKWDVSQHFLQKSEMKVTSRSTNKRKDDVRLMCCESISILFGLMSPLSQRRRKEGLRACGISRSCWLGTNDMTQFSFLLKCSTVTSVHLACALSWVHQSSLLLIINYKWLHM